eukprot:600687_1
MTHRFWKNALRSSSLSSYPQSLSPSALRLLCVLDVRWVLIADPMSLRRTPQSPIYQNEFHSNARVNVLPSVNITTSNTFTASAANKTTHFCVVIPIHPLTVVASLLHFVSDSALCIAILSLICSFQIPFCHDKLGINRKCLRRGNKQP